MPDEHQRHTSAGGRSRWFARWVLPPGLVCLWVLALVSCSPIGGSPQEPSAKDVSSTAEAVQFATSEAIRQATRDVVDPINTKAAHSTATVAARELQAQVSRTSAASTSQARSTAQARQAATARANAIETARAEAEIATVQLEKRASQVYGPSQGELIYTGGDQVPCDDAGVSVRNFVVQAKLHNPQASPGSPGEAWDYGIILLSANDSLQHRLILNSEGRWTLNLHSRGFDIENRDTTDLLDLSQGGSNALKLFVVEDKAYFYLNGGYVSTLDLSMLGQRQSSLSARSILICAGITRGYALVGIPTLYEGFTVWSLP